MERVDSAPFEPSTYFGLWSLAAISEAANLLRSLGVRFYRIEVRYSQEHLREWCAWDSSAADPYIGYELYVHSDDLPKVGARIV
jgi:hypothetical protein